MVRDRVRLIKWLALQIRPFTTSLSVIVILGILLSLCSVGTAVASKILLDSAMKKLSNQAIVAAIIFALFILAQIAFQAIVSVMSPKIMEGVSNKIRQRIFERLLNTEWRELLKYHSGDLMTRMTSDISLVANGLVNVLPDMISLGFQLVAAFITLFIFEPMLAILAFVLGPVAILFSRFLGRKTKQLHIKTQEGESKYRAFLQEIIQNILVVKAFRLEKNVLHQIDQIQGEKIKWILRRNRMETATGTVFSLGYWLGFFLAFSWGALSLSRGGTSFGTIAAFIQLVEQIQSPFIGLANTFPRLVSTMASASRLVEIETLQPEEGGFKITNWTEAGILFDSINFGYEQEKPLLKNISLEIYSGEIVGLVGLSGEGKTTLIRLLFSFIHPASGHVYLTNNFYEKVEVCTSSRDLLSYVPQGNTLFSGTIAENLFIVGEDIAEKKIELALRSACAWDFIVKLPDGINTVIGERGYGLSEGQAQRIAIARALLRKTPIIIFDEATSQLDISTELKILQAIRNLASARTCIIITHRKEALKICNRILRLEEGKLLDITNEDQAT